jgi:hypothetical protein
MGLEEMNVSWGRGMKRWRESLTFVLILVQMLKTIRVKARRAADDTMNLIPLLQKELSAAMYVHETKGRPTDAGGRLTGTSRPGQ